MKERLFELIEQGRRGGNIGLSMGFEKLEGYMDGYLPGVSYLIAAASGVGKSTFMEYAMIYRPLMDWWHTEDPAKKARDPYWIIFNLEMTPEQIEAKLLSMYIYETYGEQIRFKEMFSRGRDSMLTDEHFELIKHCEEFLDLLDERIVYKDGAFNAEKYKRELETELKRFGKFENGDYIPNNPNQIIGVIVDHLSLTRASAGRSKKEEMDLVSSYAVQFRNKCTIVSPIMIMQFNRVSGNQERMKQGLQEPNANDLKDTGAVYEDSQVVLALHSPLKFKLSQYRGYDIKILGQNFISLILLKSRFGTSDIALGLGFYGDCSIYKELPVASQITDYEKYKDPSWTLPSQMKANFNQEDDSDAKSSNLVMSFNL